MKPYDAIQIGAVLTQCEKCQQWFYMTVPQAICVLCRRSGVESQRKG